MGYKTLDYCLSRFGQELITEFKHFGIFKTFKTNEFIIKQGQYPRYLPIVLEGCVKVYSSEDGQQVLLYYILPKHPSILSTIHLFNREPVEFSAVAEEETKMLLIPVNKAREWIVKFPSFANLIIGDFQQHYNELLHSTRLIVTYKLEERLLVYLKTKSTNSKSKILSLTHKSIADDLGTTREVISRILKKLATDNIILLEGRKIIMH